MLSSTQEAIVLTRDELIVDCNSAAIEMFGDVEKRKILGGNIFKYVDKSSKSLVLEKAKLAFTYPYEATLTRLNNSQFPALIQTTEFKTDDEYIRIITILDLSEIKQKEKMLSQSTKMAQMGEMIGNIAHQWRQPLSVITTAASGIKIKKEYDMLSDEELFKFLDSITINATHLSKTIDTFRNFIKEKVELKEVVIQDRIDNALSIIDSRITNEHISLVNNINYKIPINAIIVTGELSQVIINIINNSIDAHIDRKKIDKWIKLELYEKEENVILTIEDNAGGIKDEILPHIFEPYFTTKHQAVGTGIGLYMSYDIIKNHMKGDLYAQNRQEGVKFFIEIPVNQRQRDRKV